MIGLDSPLIDSFHGPKSRRAMAKDSADNGGRNRNRNRKSKINGNIPRIFGEVVDEDEDEDEDVKIIEYKSSSNHRHHHFTQDSRDNNEIGNSVNSVQKNINKRRGGRGRRGRSKMLSSTASGGDGNYSDYDSEVINGDRGRSRRNVDLNVNSRNIVNTKHVPGSSKISTKMRLLRGTKVEEKDSYIYDKEDDDDDEVFLPVPLEQPTLLQKSEYIIQDQEELQSIARGLY